MIHRFEDVPIEIVVEGILREHPEVLRPRGDVRLQFKHPRRGPIHIYDVSLAIQHEDRRAHVLQHAMGNGFLHGYSSFPKRVYRGDGRPDGTNINHAL